MTDTLRRDTFENVDTTDLEGIGRVDIDRVIDYVHKDLRALPTHLELYERYSRQRWNVFDLDFTQDRIDWQERMTEDERGSFLAVASGFHHGERQVEIELPVFVMGADEEYKIFLSSHVEDEARHVVFFDRFYQEAVGMTGTHVMDVLDKSYQYISETFVGPFGLLAYQAEELRQDPWDERARMRYATNYFLWIEGVLALAVMKITLSYARQRGFLPAYLTGFTATCRDEARHVQGGLRYMQDQLRRDPAMVKEVHDTLRTILIMGSTNSREVYYEPLGWTQEQVRALLIQRLRRTLDDVGIDLDDDLQRRVEKIEAVAAGG